MKHKPKIKAQDRCKNAKPPKAPKVPKAPKGAKMPISPPVFPVAPTPAPITKSELDKITDLLFWAFEKGATHIKTPYIEVSFPPLERLGASHGVNNITPDGAPAAENRAPAKNTPIYNNPIDDPDYYGQAQDNFYNHAVTPPEPK